MAEFVIMDGVKRELVEVVAPVTDGNASGHRTVYKDEMQPDDVIWNGVVTVVEVAPVAEPVVEPVVEVAAAAPATDAGWTKPTK